MSEIKSPGPPGWGLVTCIKLRVIQLLRIATPLDMQEDGIVANHVVVYGSES